MRGSHVELSARSGACTELPLLFLSARRVLDCCGPAPAFYQTPAKRGEAGWPLPPAAGATCPIVVPSDVAHVSLLVTTPVQARNDLWHKAERVAAHDPSRKVARAGAVNVCSGGDFMAATRSCHLLCAEAAGSTARAHCRRQAMPAVECRIQCGRRSARCARGGGGGGGGARPREHRPSSSYSPNPMICL